MKDKKYSLTAKERKELKNKDNTKAVTARNDVIDNNVTSESDADSQAVGVKSHGQKRITMLVAIAMIVLILTGIVVAILLYDEIRKPQGNPLATIELSTGDKLNFVLYEDTAPVAVANFMFLSMQGFYDGTVIHDNQKNWLRFMGLKSYDITDTIAYSKTEDSSTYNKFKGLDNWKAVRAIDKNAFWYRLNSESTSVKFNNLTNNEGLLCFMYSYSSCLFQISCLNGADTKIKQTERNNFTVMGSYSDQNTLDIIKRLNKGESAATENGAWYNPTEVITIKSIKIKDYNQKAWDGRKGILNNFDTHIESLSGYRSYVTESYNYNDIKS